MVWKKGEQRTSGTTRIIEWKSKDKCWKKGKWEEGRKYYKWRNKEKFERKRERGMERTENKGTQCFVYDDWQSRFKNTAHM